MAMLRVSLGFILVAISISAAAAANRLAFDSLQHARLEFTGPVGFRTGGRALQVRGPSGRRFCSARIPNYGGGDNVTAGKEGGKRAGGRGRGVCPSQSPWP